MKIRKKVGHSIITVIITLSLSLGLTGISGQEATIQIDNDDIGGVVASSEGPEAGVWVIAETDQFQTRFSKIVVTDEDGRYVIPDLPDADYEIWVRGYGLADSSKITAAPGEIANLTAVIAPSEAVAAEVYPAAYWYSMMNLPDQAEVADIPGGLNRYLAIMKNQSCVGCHQLGQLATRTIPENLGKFESSETAWVRRVQSGQAGPQMIRPLASVLRGIPFKYLANWTDRIAAGELPHSKPERPIGLERNVVVTVRDWSDPKAYLHDLSGTDRRDPTVNGYGPLYGSPELSTDLFPTLDPVKNVSTTFVAPVRDADTPTTNSDPVLQASPYWGNEAIWDSKANSHNPMLDHRGLVWYTARIRDSDNPGFCKEGSEHPSAQLTPTESAGRHLAVLNPTTGEYTFVDTCYSTHHLQFAEDDDNTLWTSGGRGVVGWLNTDMFLETGDEKKSQGWTALILDTNGNGKRDDYAEADEPIDLNLDKRIIAGYYAIMPNPADGSVWGSTSFGHPGSVVRLDPGSNPPETALAELYNIPLPGFASRGADIDRNGVVWVSLGSGHLGQFDRKKCEEPLNGPAATGDHCPEGWTFHRFPGPGFPGLPEYSVESSYYTWVDQRNTLGLGANTPIATGNLFDGVHALVNDEFVTLRVPYPLGFYSKGFEGRIDDPSIGWKGRGLWVPSGDRTPWLKEDGVGSKPLVVHFQMRPSPLAK